MPRLAHWRTLPFFLPILASSWNQTSTEAFPPVLGDEELEPFDLDVEHHPAGGARVGGLLLRRQPGGTLREDRRVRGGKVPGERLGGVPHWS